MGFPKSKNGYVYESLKKKTSRKGSSRKKINQTFRLKYQNEGKKEIRTLGHIKKDITKI